MGYRNRKGILRSLLISLLGYGGDALIAIRTALSAIRDGLRAQDPDVAKKEFEDMNSKDHY